MFKTLRPRLQHPAFDPERKFSIPWQSNLGGLWVNTAREPYFNSVVDIFVGEGRVTVPTDIRETIPLVLLSESKNPLKASTVDWVNAIERIRLAVVAKQIRGFAGREYTRGLSNSKLYAAIGPANDAPLIKNPDVEWLFRTGVAYCPQ